MLAFPDLIEPMTRVGREIRMLEDYYLEGDAVSHERILRDGKPDWNLDVIAGPRDAVLFALDLDYEPDGKERVFKFGAPRESNFRFRIPVYLNSIDEVFRVDADGLRDVEATLNEGTITIRDQASRVAIYVASEKPTERARIEARRQALMTDENALDFDPAHQEADLQVLRQHKNCLPIEHPICSDPIIPNDSKFLFMMRTILFILTLPLSSVCADQAGRKHAENDLHAQPAVRITVGHRDTDITGTDNRALQAAVDYVGNLGGGIVEIGPGEYLMRDSLHLRSRVTVRGAGANTVLKKDREYRSLLAVDGDFGEAAITVQDTAGFTIGRGIYVASKSQRNFHGVCATILNTRDNYFTLTRSMNADIMMADDGFAATIFPVISGYHLEDARVENLTVDGNREENPTKVDGCRTAGIFLYRGDSCIITHCTVRDYSGDGISFQQSNDVRVEKCVVERCAGFGLHPGSGSQRPTVKDCRAIANGEDGFFFCWRVRGGLAEGNWLENNGGHGMSIGHKDSDNFVRNNTIIGNQRGGVYWRAETKPMAAHRVTFEANTVRDNEGWGLFVDGATDGTIIRNNVIVDSGAGRQATGIRIGKEAGEVTLEGNKIRTETPVEDDRENSQR